MVSLTFKMKQKMRYFKVFIIILLIGIVGCEPDFPDNTIITIPDGTYFLIPDTMDTITLGNNRCMTIHGKDSCFVEILDNLTRSILYATGDKFFDGGITTYLLLYPQTVGKAHFRLYNNRLNFDTIIEISVKEAQPVDTDYTVYTFYPSDRNFPLTQKEAGISVTGPKTMGSKIMDAFILSSNGSGNTSRNNECDSYINIHLNYVGSAFVKFYNEDFDTLIRVDVLPSYTTFEEPPLDFDDTRDSVIAKLGEPNDEYTEGIYVSYMGYNCHGALYDYTIYVNFLSSGFVKDYEVAFTDEEAKAELKLFIEERYKKMNTLNGYYIYARAYNTSYPNIYDSETKVLVENFLQGMVIYKNPENHSIW